MTNSINFNELSKAAQDRIMRYQRKNKLFPCRVLARKSAGKGFRTSFPERGNHTLWEKKNTDKGNWRPVSGIPT